MTTAPKHLSAEARKLWTRIGTDYDLTDAAGCLLLTTALEAFDRMREAQAVIAERGAVFVDRFEQPKANPACVVERDSRAAMLAALKALNLDLEPLRDMPGRPPGS
ncbi:P27 family phage terminase small subunit [Limibacillus sp. MBR-115]|jgi:P27 family predicted phage terminase small subunit|uniref:P27 family phage terminase small subunit n=1 Tax=Limibacillus sp. MBR-115 TaxID=3156465 RepID=UPI00339A4DA2